MQDTRWGGGSYPSAEKQTVYSTAPANWRRVFLSTLAKKNSLPYYLPIARERMNVFIHFYGHYHEEKHQQIRLGFELESLIPFPTTITVILSIPPKWFVECSPSAVVRTHRQWNKERKFINHRHSIGQSKLKYARSKRNLSRQLWTNGKAQVANNFS